MKLSGTTLRLSPSDLSNHLACRHLTTLDLQAAMGLIRRPASDPRFLEVLQARGLEHERAFVDDLRARGLRIVDLSTMRLDEDGTTRTREAMAAGADAIVQAPLAHGGWGGYADVLLKVDRPGALGGWSYEPLDTKLARDTRGGTILQLCVYCDVLAELQGTRPEHFHVVTPGDPFVHQPYRVDDFGAYYRLVKQRLVSDVSGTTSPTGGTAAFGATEVAPGALSFKTYPEPTPHCDICRWWPVCDRRRRDDDHLSLVAGIRRTQMKELREQDVPTLAALASLPLPLLFRPKRGSREALERVREQARVQLAGRTAGTPGYELLPVEPGLGLTRLPEPSPGDMFLDIEGDPFAGKGGLEYLFGWVALDERPGTTEVGPYQYHWAFTPDEERRAFEAFMREAIARLDRHPGMHIYHYAPYEPSALKRLMGRHATCEQELDRLLRGGVLVDLHAIVRQALIAGVERYSIKELERLFGFTRETPLREASQALRQVEYLLETNQPVPEDDPLRSIVLSYNRDDCLSARALRDWLERLRADLVQQDTAVPRPVPREDKPSDELSERDARVRALAERLGAVGPEGDAGPEARARTLLAHMLSFHRREEKCEWWEFFRLAALDDEERLEEKSALSGLTFVTEVSRTKGGVVVNRYRFPPQEVDLPEDADLFTDSEHKVGTVAALDREARTIDIKHLKATAHERPASVVARQIIGTRELADSLYRLGEYVAEHGLQGPGPNLAARRLLMRNAPVFGEGELKRRPGEDDVAMARRLAVALDESTLAVQGPPGAGKTYIGAQMICALVRAGKRVGVCATSHKVIRHQIDEALKAADREGLALRCLQKVKKPSDEPGRVQETTKNEVVLAAIQAREVDVVGGTAWLWSREDMQSTVDVLLVDEAGQMSLANVLAIAPAARSLILLGDPQQLEQPIQGTHPDGSDVSVLEHVLGGHKTMPEGMGIFLEETRRLHPAICRYTSELFYEGKLCSHADLEHQAIIGGTPLAGAVLWYLPVAHEGNRNTAPEEVDAITALVEVLLHGGRLGAETFEPARWRDADGVVHPLTLHDILVVAPYNAQVSALRDAIPGVRAGTVDRFQGQQAPIVIYSLTTSSPDEAPRGMEFLYSLNRLNVATSRARCACVLVASPALLAPECQTPAQMRLANALCRYVELATRLM
ncbi:MAG TPA: TM0106 family RecB-like putative nuclease [Vicinamibacterales bacterium]